MTARMRLAQLRVERWSHATRQVWQLVSPLAVFGGCWLAGLRLNLTSSLPVGFYVV
jgi:hypothetical protein